VPTRNARPLETDEIRRQWQLSFDLTSHGIALVDPRTSLIQRVNPAFATMHGGTPDDFIGQPIAATLGPPWRQRVPELARTVHEQGYLRFECDRARLDGSIFPADVEVVAARDDQGALLYRLAFITDLTELRARETSERLAVERFERVFEDAPIGMVLVRAGRIERVNAEAAAVFGRTQDDMTGCDPRTLVHPEEAALTGVAHAALLEGRTPPPQDRRIVRPDGSVVHTRLTFTTLHERDDAGEPVSLVLIRDRSAEVEADQARAGALRLFATAVDQAPIGMCLVGLDGHFLRVNAALCRVLGRTEAELLAADFQELTHPHDLAADVALMHECLDGARDGYEMPKRFLTPDGKVVHALLSVTLIRTPEGAPQHFVSQVMDLTQLHVAEQQLRLLEERDRIAGELHDTSIQRLFAVGLTLQRVANGLQDPAQIRRVETAITEIDNTIASIRTAIYGLRPSAVSFT